LTGIWAELPVKIAEAHAHYNHADETIYIMGSDGNRSIYKLSLNKSIQWMEVDPQIEHTRNVHTTCLMNFENSNGNQSLIVTFGGILPQPRISRQNENTFSIVND